MSSDEVRRRLADPTLAARLGFRDSDAVDLGAAAAGVLTRPGDLDRVMALADALVHQIGNLAPSAADDPWVDVPEVSDGLGHGVLAILALAVSAPEVAAFHAGRGVGADISDATLADLGQQVSVHRLTYGDFGLHTQGWMSMVWSGGLLALGRLQFNLQPDPGGGWLLSTHIPATGPLTPDAVEASLTAARPFFATHFPDHPVTDLICQSWLLDPELAARLPGSNLAGFQRRWELYGEPEPGDEDMVL